MAKILIVEDNEMNRDMLTRRLERRGFEVIEAVNGEDGLDTAHQAQPDLILMDVSLPLMDGWEATSRLKSSAVTKHIPIIILTAHATLKDKEHSIRVGCDEYETKPVEFTRLIGKIEALL